MNSKTKIIVLHRRELLIGAIAAVIAILLLIFMISSLAGGSKDAAASSVNGAKSVSAGVSACYTPGVYRAGVSLNGNAVDIEVTVDKKQYSEYCTRKLIRTGYNALPFFGKHLFRTVCFRN